MENQRQTVIVERRSPEFKCWGVISIEASTPEKWITALRRELEEFEKYHRPLQGIFLRSDDTSNVIRPDWVNFSDKNS